ncbi:MAG: hypothetical protein ACI9G9_000016 [Psychromonas sp.]|jgi:hypothetical protein
MQTHTSQEIISKLSLLFDKIKQGNVSENEIDDAVKLSSDLHERFVILRYKSFEQKVFKKADEVKNEKIMAVPEKKVVKTQQVMSEQTPIDFSVFDEPEVKEEVIVTETEKEVIATVDEEPLFEETKSEEDVVSSDWGNYISKVVEESKGGIQKRIENLTSSFGLNERMLYTNELFDNSSDSFSNTLNLLDKLSDWDEAKSGLIRLAELNDWDKETNALDGFIAHIYRCYA